MFNVVASLLAQPLEAILVDEPGKSFVLLGLMASLLALRMELELDEDGGFA